MQSNPSLHITGDLPPWTVIELQGTVESNVGNLEGLKVGNLTKIDNTRYELNFGMEVLKGFIVQLEKPIVVFKKTHNNGETLISSCGIVSKKLVFNRRPIPMVLPHKDKNFHI